MCVLKIQVLAPLAIQAHFIDVFAPSQTHVSQTLQKNDVAITTEGALRPNKISWPAPSHLHPSITPESVHRCPSDNRKPRSNRHVT